MSIRFFLKRELMFKEVDQCIALRRLETLLSFCNSCVYKIFEGSQVSECHKCKVKSGIKTLTGNRKAQKEKSPATCALSPGC